MNERTPPYRNTLLWPATIVVLAVFFPGAGPAVAQDQIEFLSGAKTNGEVVEIHKQQREVVFEAKVGTKVFQQVYPYSRIHAVTYRGKRYVLNQKSTSATAGSAKTLRTAPEVIQLINTVGRTPPDWYEATPVEFPQSLDLSWPMPAPQPWNNQKNVGQYIWDIINPNENRWRSGIRLMHHLLRLHKEDPATSRRVMQSMASMYFRFFQDYPRAAFWWRQAKVSPSSVDGISLAECYYRLGNKKMAMDAMDKRRLRIESIKLLGNMGETQRAIANAETYARQVKEPQWALLAAGDACRHAGMFQKAIGYYQRVVDSAKMNNESYDNRARSRAIQSIEAIKQFELLDITKVPDGAYEAEALGYEGPIAVRVSVKSGRIQNVEITRHKEKQFYSALRDVPQQIVTKQSVKDVDATSRATITAEAIVSATAKALAIPSESSPR